MPLQYKRKSGVVRGKWTESDLTRAVQAHADGIGVNEAANMYGIPKSTFKRRLKNKQLTKSDVLGPCGVLTPINEKKIVTHIIKLQQRGFTPSREVVRQMAYNLAENLQIKHNFNRDKKIAGFGWLESFLRRNPELSIRKSEEECAGCEENYDDTLSRHDCLQCTICERWSHESCTKYKNMCERCGDTLTN